MTARFTVGEVQAALGVAPRPLPARSGVPAAFRSVSTDTRTLEPGALFVALRGERHDGMDFLRDAAAAGATGAVVRAGEPLPDVELAWFPVEDPLRALGELAAAHRRRRGARVVGITGSSGKTTVKEMAAEALGGEPGVHRTPGNLNNRVGLPLSILGAPEGAATWVLELGTNRPGEIRRLTEIGEPDDAVITTVGPAHLEGLGSVEGVLEEKLDLVRGARDDGKVVVGERPSRLASAARRVRPDAVVAGLSEGADYRPEGWTVDAGRVAFVRAGVRFVVEAGGEHHLRDALIAAALAEGMGRDPGEVAAGLRRFRPLEMRSELRRAGRVTIVADCYNANPESFDAAIRHCVEGFPERRKVAVVGTMLELGAGAEAAHRRVARSLLSAGFDLVAATGAFREAVRRAAAGEEGRGPAAEVVVVADSVKELWDALAPRLRGDELVLVKASRGVRLERIVERLEDRFGDAGRAAAAGTAGETG